MVFGNRMRNRQTDTVAIRIACSARRIGSVEAVEYLREFMFSNTDTGICHGDHDIRLLEYGLHSNGRVIRTVFDSIFH